MRLLATSGRAANAGKAKCHWRRQHGRDTEILWFVPCVALNQPVDYEGEVLLRLKDD